MIGGLLATTHAANADCYGYPGVVSVATNSGYYDPGFYGGWSYPYAGAVYRPYLYPRAYGWRGGYYGGWRGGAVAWRGGGYGWRGGGVAWRRGWYR